MSDARLTDYDFALPPGRIAQEPAAERRDSRLLVLPRDGSSGRGIRHLRFPDLAGELRAGDLLVLNDTRVIPARIELRRATGGRVGGLLLGTPSDGRADLLLEGRGRLSPGDVLAVAASPTTSLTLLESRGGGVWRVAGDAAAFAALLGSGRMPLPPYITRGRGGDPRDALDRQRYQTVFAARDGAIAAPTAGLHFDAALLAQLAIRGIGVARVTLHVGLGTFLPVRVEALAEHAMHREACEILAPAVAAIRSARDRGGRVVAVGTTVVRTLETWALAGEPDSFGGETDLFIRPPFDFRVVDALLTNFHLPKSTLLVLVAAFAGRERVLAAYREAIELEYRFFSYGDAMFIV